MGEKKGEKRMGWGVAGTDQVEGVMPEGLWQGHRRE